MSAIVCGRKFCCRCGRWRLTIDFSCHTRRPDGSLRLNANCRPCEATRRRELAKNNFQARVRTAEQQRRWAEAKRRKAGIPTREEWNRERERKIICGRTHCSVCKRWRPVSDFPPRSWRDPIPKLKSACYCCRRAEMRETQRRRKQDPERITLRREYDRIYKEMQRRKAGIPPREWGEKCHRGDPAPGGHAELDVDPLEAWVGAMLAQDRRTRREIAAAMRVDTRVLWRFEAHEYEHVSLAVADELVWGYGRSVFISRRSLETKLVEWAESLPGNGTRLLRYLDRAEKVAHLADQLVSRVEDLYPELDEVGA